jgi:glycerophosphoryl diester phosphodiesterase
MIPLERHDGRPLVIGHRGAADLAPENTLRALRAGLEAGVDLIEFDVLALASGELVLAHSDDLREVTHGAASGRVHDLSLDALRALAPELPTLDDALRFFTDEAPEVGVHLDLKSRGVEEQVVETLGAHGVAERTLITSGRLDVARRLAILDPQIRIGFTFPEDRHGISRRRGGGLFVWAGLRWVKALTPFLVARLLGRSGATALSLQHTLVTRAVVDRAHRLGAAVVAWTVKRPADLARVDAAGVDAVVVNDPRIALDVPRMFDEGSG